MTMATNQLKYRKRKSVFAYMQKQIEKHKKMGKIRTADSYWETYCSFLKFRDGVDVSFRGITAELMENYQAFMQQQSLCRNSTSFHLRNLRSIYNRAVSEGVIPQGNPFATVYTGIDKTSKRAIDYTELKRIKRLDLSDNPAVDFARDIFLLSFYLRGMSFVDIAFLRKKDLVNGYVTYIRRKTGQQLTIRWEPEMQSIIDKYAARTATIPYLLPIIEREDGTEYRQYLNKSLFVNRKLKMIARKIGMQIPLSLYVARHSWASIAREKNVSLSVISEGMGHDSEITTQIYLASVQIAKVDEANAMIMKGL